MVLPTFRRRILRDFLTIVLVFGVFGAFLIAVLSATGSVPPALVHLNYDSIEAADRMTQAWNALRMPAAYPYLTEAQATEQFERALRFENGNFTEAGEKELSDAISRRWAAAKAGSPGSVSDADFAAMHALLRKVIEVNEKGMFARVERAKRLNQIALAASGLVLLVVLGISVYLADTLATRLASPLKRMAEALHARPTLDKPLKLPTPTTIELRILIREMRRLWDSLADADKVNVTEIIQQQRKLETLVASVEDAFMGFDVAEVVTHCNQRMQELIGLPEAEIVGKRWQDLSTMSENYLLLRDLLKKEDCEAEVEMHAGDIRYNFTVRSRRILGAGDQTVGRLVLLRDVTERRQRDRLKAELIDLLSHELKTPVQSLGLAAEMLERNKAGIDERLRFFVDTINEDVARIRAVSQQFIQATQTQAKSLRLDLRRVPLRDDLRNWLKPFEVIAAAKGVKLLYRAANDHPLWVAVDTVKFPWAVSNLLSNALRLSPPGSTVTVTAAQRQDRTEVEVADEGPGVSDEVRRRMYEPFYQGPAGEGSGGERGFLGVGLTIAKEVVEGHEGRLEYERREPHGSIFRISLPTPAAMEA